MEKELPIVKMATPVEGMPGSANFHFQVLSRQAQNSNTGHTYIAAYIPGEMHQRIFERAIVSFENHYYRAEIEDSNFDKFSRSIRSINTGMDEIRQYYKDQRQAYEYSFCIITVTESEFLLSACGKTYIVAEDRQNRLHEVYSPEEFLDFSEIISGSHSQLKALYLNVASFERAPLSSQLTELAHTTLMACEQRTDLPWLSAIIDLATPSNTVSAPGKAKSSSGLLATLQTTVKKHFRTISHKLSSRNKSSQPNNQPQHNSPKSSKKFTKSMQNFWTKIWSKYINPNPLRAIIVVGIIIAAIIVGIIGWSIYGGNQKTTAQYQQINLLYNTALTSKNNQDQVSAESQFKQLSSQISTLSASQKANLDKYAKSHNQPSLEEIEQNSQVAIDELNNIFRASATKIYSESDFSYSLLAVNGTEAYMLNPTNGKTLGYIPTTQKASSKTSTSLSNTQWLSSSPETPQVFAASANTVFQIKTDLSVSETRTAASTWPKAQSFSTYSGSLYFLMPSLGQIYRFRPVGSNSFGPQTNYLKAVDPNINKAVAFVVAGTIFTTTSTGQIGQYSQGAPQAITTSSLPSLSSITQIAYRTAPESLVLLDKDTHSFVFLKIQASTASFQKTIVVNNTTNISSFSLDEKNNQIYFVSPDGLFSLPLP